MKQVLYKGQESFKKKIPVEKLQVEIYTKLKHKKQSTVAELTVLLHPVWVLFWPLFKVKLMIV